MLGLQNGKQILDLCPTNDFHLELMCRQHYFMSGVYRGEGGKEKRVERGRVQLSNYSGAAAGGGQGGAAPLFFSDRQTWCVWE